MATMDDIARSLGVSKGTVSKALSGAEDVSEAMRKAIVERAVELGYSRIKRGGQRRRVCIFVAHMKYESEEDFGYEFIVGFRKLAEPAGFSVDVIELTEEMQLASAYDEYMFRHGYEGALFLWLGDSDPWAESVRTCRTPAVLYDHPGCDNPVVTQVGIDSVEAMMMAVAHLRALGHRRIGYLGSGDLQSALCRRRCGAYLGAMRSCGLSGEGLMGLSTYTADCILKHLPELLSRGCTAILCSHDLLAQAVVTHCEELGITVPGKLSVIGFDDIPLCRYTKPPLTTIRQNRAELGKCAFYALSSQLGGTHLGQILLHAELVVRGSTAEVGDE